jgi:hypothetical protein
MAWRSVDARAGTVPSRIPPVPPELDDVAVTVPS